MDLLKERRHVALLEQQGESADIKTGRKWRFLDGPTPNPIEMQEKYEQLAVWSFQCTPSLGIFQLPLAPSPPSLSLRPPNLPLSSLPYPTQRIYTLSG